MTIEINYSFKVHNVKLPSGVNIAYIDEGQGSETMLFIHGLATYADSWRKNIDGLKNNYRCIAIDLPGNGLSDRGEYPYSISFFAGVVYEFIQQLGLQRVCLVGHSMGGQIALSLLLDKPACADKLVLCAPAGLEVFTPLEKTMSLASLNVLGMFSTDESNLKNTVNNSFYHNPAQADDMLKKLVQLISTYPPNAYKKMIEGCIKGMLHEPVFNSLKRVSQPTLIIFGERDALIPNTLIHHTTTKQLAAAAVKLMPDAKMEIIPRCGHFVMWEKADVVNELIRKFAAG